MGNVKSIKTLLVTILTIGIIAMLPASAGAEDVKTTTDAHPTYTTKLFLEKYIIVMDRLMFVGWTDSKSFQIDTVDIHQPTQILKMGDVIAGTKFKIVGFVEKHNMNDGGVNTDVSELTIQNTETNDKVVLVLGKSSPHSYAVFKYLWNGSSEIRVKMGATFSLPQEPDVNYKLIDINKDEARIMDVKTTKVILIPKEPTTSNAATEK